MVVAVAALLPGCGPPAVSSWDGCLTRDAIIRRDPASGIHYASGRGSILTLGVRWGEVPFISDTLQSMGISVALPLEPQLGDLDLATLERYHYAREWNTPELSGQLQILELEPTTALVAIDATTTSSEGEPRAIRGTVPVKRGQGPLCRQGD